MYCLGSVRFTLKRGALCLWVPVLEGMGHGLLMGCSQESQVQRSFIPAISYFEVTWKNHRAILSSLLPC